MSKLNPTTRVSTPKTIVNHEDHVNAAISAKEALISVLTTSMLSEKYYATAGQGLDELRDIIDRLATIDPEFVLKAAAYARKIMNMRSMPVVTLAECANRQAYKKYVRKYGEIILSRADEPSDVLSYYLTMFGKPIPQCLRKACRDAIEGFSIYQLTKYAKPSASMKMADVIKLVHPRCLGNIGKAIIEGTYEHANTWETTLSKNDGREKNEKWETIIPSMGYMALLRNLRNFLNENISDELLTMVCNKISDKEQVANSKQLPFRFYSAYKEILSLTNSARVRKVRTALKTALDHSVGNFDLGGRTLIICDTSGSMMHSLSDRSAMSYLEVGLLFSVVTRFAAQDSASWCFDSTTRDLVVNTDSTIIAETDKAVQENHYGGATYFDIALNRLLSSKVVYDKVIVFSDMQVYEGGYACRNFNTNSISTLWNKYRATVNPNAVMYSVDIAGYNKGTPIAKKDGAILFAGWSDKVLDFICNANSESTMLKEIENYVV